MAPGTTPRPTCDPLGQPATDLASLTWSVVQAGTPFWLILTPSHDHDQDCGVAGRKDGLALLTAESCQAPLNGAGDCLVPAPLLPVAVTLQVDSVETACAVPAAPRAMIAPSASPSVTLLLILILLSC